MTLTRFNMRNVSTLCLHIPSLIDSYPPWTSQSFSSWSSPSSTTTLRAAVLVCRKWFLLNQDRLHREVTWDLNWKPSKPRHALARLPGAERLVVICQSGHACSSPDLHAALSSLQPPSTLWSTLAPF